MATSSTPNPLFVPRATTFPLTGSENLIILQGNDVTQARLNDIIFSLVTNVTILNPQYVTTNSFTLTSLGLKWLFVTYNGAVSIILNPAYVIAGQEIKILDRLGSASPTQPITITATGGANFDGDTSVVINSPYGQAFLIFDGTNFGVIS